MILYFVVPTGFIVFNVNQPSCDPSDVVTEFAEDGGSYLEYNETRDAIVVSNRIDVDVLRDGVVCKLPLTSPSDSFTHTENISTL